MALPTVLHIKKIYEKNQVIAFLTKYKFLYAYKHVHI